MKEISRDFYRHVTTGEVYAIERQWDGELVGSAGPLQEGALWPLAEYEYTPERNDWVKDNNDKLILL